MQTGELPNHSKENTNQKSSVSQIFCSWNK